MEEAHFDPILDHPDHLDAVRYGGVCVGDSSDS